MDRTGQTIDGFRVTDKLIEEPRCSLYEVKQGRIRAQLKIFEAATAEAPRYSERFLRGAQALRKVSHAALAPVLSCGRLPDGSAYLINQPAEGRILNDLLVTRRLEGPDRFSVLSDLADALSACHAQNVKYLGVQPRQIMIHQRPGSSKLHAQFLDTDTVIEGDVQSAPLPTLTDGVVTDPFDAIHYMAPEYFTSQHPISEKTDSYAFGALAYQVFSGRSPFAAEHTGELIAEHVSHVPAPLRTLASDIPESIARLVHALLSKSPDKRPPLSEVAAELARHATTTLPRGEAVDDMEDAALPAPETFGEYKVIQKLGSGGMGTVYEVESSLQRRAAIKILHPSLARQSQFTERFLSEVRAANIINHPGIISILHTGKTEEGRPYIVMEYLAGQDLRKLLEEGPLSPNAVIQLGWQIALALSAAHAKGIIHRDLKPENIMVVSDLTVAGEMRTKILDFGIAKLRSDQQAASRHRTRTGAVMGTPMYMSPEQLQDSARVDAAADVYSLGVMLYELLAGTLTPGRPLLGPPCPPVLAQLISRMQALDPAQRPAMQEVMRVLASLRPSAQEAQKSLTAGIQAPAVQRRSIAPGFPLRRVLLGVIGTGTLVAVVALFVHFFRGAQEVSGRVVPDAAALAAVAPAIQDTPSPRPDGAATPTVGQLRLADPARASDATISTDLDKNKTGGGAKNRVDDELNRLRVEAQRAKDRADAELNKRLANSRLANSGAYMAHVKKKLISAIKQCGTPGNKYEITLSIDHIGKPRNIAVNGTNWLCITAEVNNLQFSKISTPIETLRITINGSELM